MNRQQQSNSNAESELSPSHRRQLRRLKELANEPATFEQLAVAPKTYDRAKTLVDLLWKNADLESQTILDQAFLTLTGGGDIQLEWQIDGRYFEIEVPPDGPFPYYSERGIEEIEAVAPNAAKLVGVFRRFWKS